MAQTPVASVPVAETPKGCEAYRHIIEGYEWDTRLMMAIMEGESRCNPNAVGDTWEIGGITAPSCGLMQVRTLKGRPSCEQLKDPVTNIATAYKIYKGQGLRAWSVYNNGSYKKHL